MRRDEPYRPPEVDLAAAAAGPPLPGVSVDPGPDGADVLDGTILTFFDGLADARELAVWGAWREGRA